MTMILCGPSRFRAVDLDPHSFMDPDPGGKQFQRKKNKCKEISDNCNFRKNFK